MMKEKMLEYLRSSEWSCTGCNPNDDSLICGFINAFFDHFQPERLNVLASEEDAKVWTREETT